MTWRSQDFRCTSCAATIILTYRKEDGLPTPACPACGSEMENTFGAPLVMGAAWPDGYKRGGSWDAARRQARIETDWDKVRDSKDKKDMQKEFKRVGGKE